MASGDRRHGLVGHEGGAARRGLVEPGDEDHADVGLVDAGENRHVVADEGSADGSTAADPLDRFPGSGELRARGASSPRLLRP
jgi:hypothetical protein